MTKLSPQQQEALATAVADAARALTSLIRRLRRTNAGLLISGIVSSAVSTLITGITAAQGPIVGSGTEGWRLACIVAAVFSFGTTVSVGLNQRLKIGERLAETQQCAGRLRALRVAIATSTREWDAIAKEYEEIVRSYPQLIK
ncbi:MAG: hypothetical protein JXC32_10765 [Anaerolineae bacterium]|nr:hypothetical protein [Anaerolineae bacterium]